MDILTVNSLKKYFAEQKAVDDISFTLERGSIFGLLGPNGAGKTMVHQIRNAKLVEQESGRPE